MIDDLIFRGTLILPDRILSRGAVRVREGRIAAVGPAAEVLAGIDSPTVIEAGSGYLAPGFVDLHVHGGGGADFMDATDDAFATALAAHARHGTTSFCPTTTAARHEQILAMLEVCQYLAYADSIATASVAPELPGAEDFARACVLHGIRIGAGHSQATFGQMAAAVSWGVQHVDHLYCAMSDKTKLRRTQPYPMQGGVLEATFYYDELTTEVIADGRHLTADLLLLALKIKGPDRLALVTDCNRALDLPEGRYIFGPLEGGQEFISRGGVGVMPDGQALASGTQGLDHMVRTFASTTGRPLWEVVRMASLTPARIAGHERDIGSLEAGKWADVLVLDQWLRVQRVFVAGEEFADSIPIA
jgi:N-acetylglucosamine-6-phosphate deacetylase